MNRYERRLHHQKNTTNTTGNTVPQSAEGASGDVTIRNIAGQIRIYAKYGQNWYGRDLGPTVVLGETNKKHVQIGSGGINIKDGTVSLASFGANTVITTINGGTITFNDGTRDRVVIGSNDIDMYDEAGNNTLNIDTGVITIGHHSNSKIILTGTAGTGSTDEAITIGSKFKVYGDASVEISDIHLKGYINTEGGNNNLMIGTNNGTGRYNIGIGNNALEDCSGTVDTSNVAIGNNAGKNINAYIGNNPTSNVCIGTSAGSSIRSGSYNIAIGHSSDCSILVDDQIAIGRGVVTNAASQVRIGNSSYFTSLDASQASQSFAATSDIRIKKDIEDIDLGLNFIKLLRPVKYREKPTSEFPKEFKVKYPSNKTVNIIHDGLIAQEVKEAADNLNSTFSGWSEDIDTRQELQYGKFTVPLIKAVQELSDEIDILKGYHARR